MHDGPHDADGRWGETPLWSWGTSPGIWVAKSMASLCCIITIVQNYTLSKIKTKAPKLRYSVNISKAEKHTLNTWSTPASQRYNVIVSWLSEQDAQSTHLGLGQLWLHIALLHSYSSHSQLAQPLEHHTHKPVSSPPGTFPLETAFCLLV